MQRFSAFLREKKFGLPVWAWGLIVATLVIAMIYWRRKKAAEAAANADTNATPLDAGQAAQLQQMPDDSGAGGGMFTPSQVPYSVGVDPGAGYDFSTDGSVLPFAPTGSDQLVPQNDTPQAPGSPTKKSGSSSSILKAAETPVSAKNPNFAQAAQARTAAGKQAGVPVPFGGVVGTTKLKNGATLTTYATGRQVEQAPGKSAYVTKKGSSAPVHPGAVL